MKKKTLKITQKDYMLANRKASREIEIDSYGKQILFRGNLFVSRKKYDRNKAKKELRHAFINTPSDY